MKRNETAERLNEKIAKLIDKVESAGSWVKPFKTSIANGVPLNIKTGKPYQGINIFNLLDEADSNGYSTNIWGTFKQWKEEGYKIKKGEKSTEIYFFKPLKITITDTETGEEEEKTIPMLKRYVVFNRDQTDAPAIEKPERNKVSIIEHAERFYSAVDYLEVHQANKAYYSNSGDYIGIPDISDFISAEEYYSTLGHEHIHATGHSSRLNRPKGAKFGSAAYAYEELIAEIGSVILMAHLGLEAEPVQDNSAAYLRSWLQSLKDDPKQLWKAASEASKAANYIIDHAESALMFGAAETA